MEKTVCTGTFGSGAETYAAGGSEAVVSAATVSGVMVGSARGGGLESI